MSIAPMSGGQHEGNVFPSLTFREEAGLELSTDNRMGENKMREVKS